MCDKCVVLLGSLALPLALSLALSPEPPSERLLFSLNHYVLWSSSSYPKPLFRLSLVSPGVSDFELRC